MAKYKPPCTTCKGTGALVTERCPDCTATRSGLLPRETKKLYLTLFERFGRWEPGLFCFVNAVSPELRAEGERAREFYLSRIAPVEARSKATPWGLVAPPDVLPAPTFAPFVPATRPSQGGAGVVHERREYATVDLSRTCGACGQKTVDLGVCSTCGALKEAGPAELVELPPERVEELPPDLGDAAADFKRLFRGFRKTPKVELPTEEEQAIDDSEIPF